MLKDIVKSVLPEKAFSNLKTLYKENITHYKRDIYSEFGEDFIAAVLLGFKKDGLFVDVGAFRPKELSTTYYFYKKLGWSGLIVEPNPSAKSEFEDQRPRDKFLNMGAANQEATLTYYKFDDATLNSFDEKVFEKNKSRLIGKEEIQVRPLRTILEENLPENKEIDLMNIDVEGLDYEVLESNDWEKFSPKVIIIEDHLFEAEKPLESKIVQFLKAKGYSLKSFCHISLIFFKGE